MFDFEDINECELKYCDPRASCNNLNGTFECGACPIGFEGTGYTGCLGILIIF